MKNIADLFCGAGGTSTGILQACQSLNVRANLLAVNHWTTAINTHSLNHPGVRHLCESLDVINPREAVGGRGHLHLLAASPECTHHSVAAGGRPKNDQSRATAWHVCRWAADLKVENILIENVREFRDWGPLGSNGRPIKSRKGETFMAFVNALHSMGYNVEWRVQNAAAFGDPTSRRRLIVMATRGRAVPWPTESHGESDLLNRRQPYRTAREIIDWGLKGKSIFRRKRPLSPNTLRRIAAGLRKFGGQNAEPFLVILNGTGGDQIPSTARTVDMPMPTQTTCGHIGLAEPFLIQTDQTGSNGPCSRPVDSPLGTIVTKQNIALVEPFIVGAGGPARAGEPQPVDNPVGTIQTRNHRALIQPFITHLTHQGERKQHSTDEPLPTVTGAHRGKLALIEPILLGQQSGHNGSPVDQPCPTVATAGAIGLVEPFIVKYYGNERAGESLSEPLDTVTTKDRFMLVEPRTGRAVAEIDILFRMLQPHELAAAMSFPADYKFTGNRGEQVKQIGNAVPVGLARAHALALLS